MKLNELMGLSEEEIDKKLTEWMEHEARPEIQAQRKEELASRLRGYEKKYSFSTTEMRLRLKNDVITETNDICNWSIDADLWEQAYGDLP